MFIMNGIGSLFEFAGGIGMFLYGMNRMADGMQKSAGGKMKSLLGYLTRNRFLAILVGALITAIIQSSGATTVMVVGFVNAGLMTLVQAVGVIMGANIGTTITAWIVSLGQIGDAAKALQPSFYAPLLIGIGAFVSLFSKKDRSKTVGELFVGIGLLFEGLEFMSASIAPYTDAPIFSNAFKIVGSNPFLGILIGIVVTAILQSSSASVGILQTLAMNGVVTTNAAIFITLGQNIGSCVTALISSAGTTRTAKRAACMHLLFNVAGALLFGTAGFILFCIRPDIAVHNITGVEISIFHTFFNITCTAVMFPFAKLLVKLSGIIVPENHGIDIRKYGSGNSGSTNALRVMGKKAGLTVFLGDFLKTVIPCMAVRFVFKDQPDYAYVYMLYIGLGVILGHNYPFYLHFKGGKGIAATAGIIFSIDWRLTVLCLAVFVLIVAVTRYVSLGSLVVSVILLAWNIYMGRCGAYSLSAISSIEYSAVTAVIAAMAFWRHRANIVRLIHGNENKIGAKKS